MILRKLIIKNHESHKDTTFEFGPGLNCIYGKSNHGKSSALRALELPSYGTWAAGENKKIGVSGPVRIGASACEIYVESDVGSVRVRKGKGINEWEIKNFKTGENLNLSNPGAGAIPQAQEVLGMKSIEIAGSMIRFNWSDQRDKHFLIDEVEGKSSSPSFVAAVLDEVGGLSGCEELIRSLASDKSKFEQDMKKAGESASIVVEDLESYADLDEKLEKVKKAENLVLQIDDAIKKSCQIRDLRTKISDAQNKLKNYEELDAEILKREKAEELLDQAVTAHSKFEKSSALRDTFNDLNDKLKKSEINLIRSQKIDVEKVQESCSESKELIESVEAIRKLFGQFKRKQAALKRMPNVFQDFSFAEKLLEEASKISVSLNLLHKLRTSVGVANASLGGLVSALAKVDKRLETGQKEFEDILNSAGDICFFCNQSLSIKCKEEILARA